MLLQGDFQERNAATVTLKEIPFDAVEMLVEFIYTGNLFFTKCSIGQALITADYLLIDCATVRLNEYISKNINLLNCVEIYQVSNYLRKDVALKVESFIKKNLGDSPRPIDIYSLDIHEVEKILKNTTPVQRHLSDMEFVINWVRTLPNTRHEHVPKLLPLVEFKGKVDVSSVLYFP